MRKFIFGGFWMFGLAAVFSFPVSAQQVKRAAYDVTHYTINAALSPVEQKMTATADVTFTPLEETRAVAFELNGSLKIDSITRIEKQLVMTPGSPAASPKTAPKPANLTTIANPITFVQDQTNSSDLGPHVRIDLGDNVPNGVPITLRFVYSGVLASPAGGPLLSKRLAYVGADQGYLMYAARWFPFHDYAADFATADITLDLPSDFQVVGYSDSPISTVGGKTRFVQATPALPGNYAYGKYVARTIRLGEHEMNFYAKPGTDAQISDYGAAIGKALESYTKDFGPAAYGKKLAIVEIDDESLDFYTTRGMLFIASRPFEENREFMRDRLQREVAYQWWGHTVGLKSFDDAWLSQGLAEFCAYALREETLDGAKLDGIRRELLEKSLTFEQVASIRRAPSTLDDQSSGYQYIMFAKGAFAFKLLRDTLGEQKFDRLLRTFLQEYRGKTASIDDFEKLATRVAGENMRYFFARWVESTGVPEFLSEYLIIRTRGGKFVTRGTVKQNYDNLRLPVEVQLRSEGDQGLTTVKLD
ncbi:MAG: M1 family metallopeptidase, partial [Pyrinomonadaceae bacterium]